MSPLNPYPFPKIAAAFGDLVDPRDGPAMRHRLLETLTIAVIRKLPLNLLKSTPNPKQRSLRILRNRARWSIEILYDMLGIS